MPYHSSYTHDPPFLVLRECILGAGDHAGIPARCVRNRLPPYLLERLKGFIHLVLKKRAELLNLSVRPQMSSETILAYKKQNDSSPYEHRVGGLFPLFWRSDKAAASCPNAERASFPASCQEIHIFLSNNYDRSLSLSVQNEGCGVFPAGGPSGHTMRAAALRRALPSAQVAFRCGLEDLRGSSMGSF